MKKILEKRLEEIRNERQDLINKGKTIENILTEIQYKVIGLNSKEEELVSLLENIEDDEEDTTNDTE